MTEKSLIHEISANLAAAVEQEIKKIPESVFKYYFLPLFSGETPPANTTAQTWENVAGNPFMAVDVVDDTTGEVIYRVPSLYDMEGVATPERPKGMPSMINILLNMRQLAAHHPKQGQAYLMHQLEVRNQQLIRVSPELAKRIEMLNIIFKRYNKPLIMLSEDGTHGVPDPKSQGTAVSGGDEELLYD